MSDCGGVLMLQSAVHNDPDGQAGCHTWWHGHRTYSSIPFASWTFDYFLFGIHQYLAWHYYAMFLFMYMSMSTGLYTGSGHAEVWVNKLLA